jgi:hypothetical protein
MGWGANPARAGEPGFPNDLPGSAKSRFSGWPAATCDLQSPQQQAVVDADLRRHDEW